MFKNLISNYIFNGFSILGLFLSTSILAFDASSAHAWGHSGDFNQKWGSSYLVFAIRDRAALSYCIEIGDSRFGKKELQLEVKAALHLWLSAPKLNQKLQFIQITEVECDSRVFDLKVRISPAKFYPGLGSYQVAESDDRGRYYSLIQIDSEFTYTENGIHYSNIPFQSLLRSDQDERSVIQNISFLHPLTLKEFATQAGVSKNLAYWSTYKTLIHEIGHSFGLCDTYASEIQSCDPNFMSRAQPDSIMKTSEFFYLTSDDISGIQFLFTRFLKL